MQVKADSDPWVIVTSRASDNGLGVVRGLGKRGIPVALLALDRASPARHSRYVTEVIPCVDSPSNEDQFVEQLIAFSRKRRQPPVLLATGDQETQWLARNMERIRPHCRFLVSEPEVIEDCTDKARFYARLKKLQIAHPTTIEAHTAEEVETAARTVGYPFLLKPRHSERFTARFLKKLFFISSAASLARCLAVLEPSDYSILVQEYLATDLYHEVSCLRSAEGNDLGIVAYDRIRQYPPRFGAATFCRTTLRQPALDLALEVLNALGFRGIGSVEMALDPGTGRFQVIEVNPRSPLQNPLCRSAGVDLEWLAFRYLNGEPLEEAPAFEQGIAWVNDFKDPLTIAQSLVDEPGKIRLIDSRKGRRLVHSSVSLRDPLPAVVGALQLCRKVPQGLKHFRLGK